MKKNQLASVLKWFAVGSLGLVLLQILIAWYSVNSANNELDGPVEEYTRAKDTLNLVRFHVIQIQQFITDSAATGEDDGVADATLNRDEAKALLRQLDTPYLRQNIGSSFNPDRLSNQVDELFHTGEEMVKAYRVGRDDGNKIMKQSGGFDEKSEALSDAILALNKQIDEKRGSSFTTLDHILERSLAALYLIGALIVVAMALGLRWLRQQLMLLLGADPAQASQLAIELSQGNLHQSVDAASAPSGSVFASLGTMRNRWRDLAANLLNQAVLLSQQANNMARRAHDLSESSEKQGNAVNNIAQAMENIQSNAQSICAEAESTSEFVLAVGQQARDNVANVQRVTDEINQLSLSIRNSAELVSALDSKATAIATIVTDIRGIADQTNLLALNAAIEAARAGESGRGFAVVADEVRNLASHTARSTADISQKIAEVHDATKNIVDSITQAVDRVTVSVTQANQAADAMNEIERSSQLAVNQVKRIEESIAVQTKAIEESHRNADQIRLITRKNTFTSDEVSKSSTQIKSLADLITNEVSFFKINNDESAPSGESTLF